MDWNDLQVVLAVARQRTLSGAAVALNLTHTTVGRRLTRFERSLDVRLFDRTPAGFFATDAGEQLVQLATEVEASVHQAESGIRGQDAVLAGELRVSTLDVLFETAAPVFASFQEAHPSVQLTVTADTAQVSLFRREADVAFRMTNQPPETLVGRRVGRVSFAVYAHRSLAERTTVWAELPWLHWDPRLPDYARWLDGWLAEHAPGATITMRLGENTLVRRAAMRAGIGVHPLACLEGDRDPDLVRVGPVLTDYTREVWLLMLPALSRTRRVRAFVEHMAAHLRFDDIS